MSQQWAYRKNKWLLGTGDDKHYVYTLLIETGDTVSSLTYVMDGDIEKVSLLMIEFSLCIQ